MGLLDQPNQAPIQFGNYGKRTVSISLVPWRLNMDPEENGSIFLVALPQAPRFMKLSLDGRREYSPSKRAGSDRLPAAESVFRLTILFKISISFRFKSIL